MKWRISKWTTMCGSLSRQRVLLINSGAAVDKLRAPHTQLLLSPRWRVRRPGRPCRPTAPPQRRCLVQRTWPSSPPIGCCTGAAQSAPLWRKPLSRAEVSCLTQCIMCVWKGFNWTFIIHTTINYLFKVKKITLLYLLLIRFFNFLDFETFLFCHKHSLILM